MRFIDTFSHQKAVVFKDPDSLKQTSTVPVKTRIERWNSFISSFNEGEGARTDVGNILVAAYMAGMVSPSHASRFTAVNADSLHKGREWLGTAKIYRELAPQK